MKSLKKCQQKLPADIKFANSYIEKEKILKYRSNIDINKATGSYGIGPRLLKLAAPHIAEYL